MFPVELSDVHQSNNQWVHRLLLICWVFPSMSTLAVHFKSVLFSNYDAFREPLKVKFTRSGSTRYIKPFSVQYTDGHTKGLICQAIIGLIDYLDAQLIVLVCFFECYILKHIHGFPVMEFVLACDCSSLQFKGMDDSDFESAELKPLLVSMKYLKGQYVHHKDEAAYFYEALRPELNVEMNHINQQQHLSLV